MAPLDETSSPTPPPVLAKLTGPLGTFVSSWSVKADDPVTVTEPEVGLVWVMVTALTVSV